MTETATAERIARVAGRTIDATITNTARPGYNYVVTVVDRETGRQLTEHVAILALNVEAFLEKLQESADRLELCLTVVDNTRSGRFITGLAR
jgi:hypothetical protein